MATFRRTDTIYRLEGLLVPASKAELESARNAYHSMALQANQALQVGGYAQAIAAAVASWAHVSGMLQFEHRFGSGDPKVIGTIEIVLSYAPLLFDHRSLNQLETVLKEERRIEKNTGANYSSRLEVARATMWYAHGLWSALQSAVAVNESDLLARLGGARNGLHAIANAWEAMGFVRRAMNGPAATLALITRMQDPVLGKCPACGATGSAPKRKFLDQLSCPSCRASVFFVILNNGPTPAAAR